MSSKVWEGIGGRVGSQGRGPKGSRPYPSPIPFSHKIYPVKSPPEVVEDIQVSPLGKGRVFHGGGTDGEVVPTASISDVSTQWPTPLPLLFSPGHSKPQVFGDEREREGLEESLFWVTRRGERTKRCRSRTLGCYDLG